MEFVAVVISGIVAWFTNLPGHIADNSLTAAGWVNTHTGLFGIACAAGFVLAVTGGALRLTSRRRSGRNGG